MSKASFSNETKDSRGSQQNIPSGTMNAFNLYGSKQIVKNKILSGQSPSLSVFDSNSSMRSIPDYNKFNSGSIPFINTNPYLNPYSASAFNSLNSFNSNNLNTAPSNHFYPSMGNLIQNPKQEPIMISQPSDKFKALLEDYDKRTSNTQVTREFQDFNTSKLGSFPKAYKPCDIPSSKYEFKDLKKFNSTRPNQTSINPNLFNCKTEKDFQSAKSTKMNRSLLGIRLEEGNDEDIIAVPQVVDQILAKKFNKELRIDKPSNVQAADDWQEYLSKNHPEEFATLLEKKN